jgi:hypothetical protein
VLINHYEGAYNFEKSKIKNLSIIGNMMQIFKKEVERCGDKFRKLLNT